MGRFLLHFPDEVVPTPKWRARLDTTADIVRRGVTSVVLSASIYVIAFQVTDGDWSMSHLREMILSALKSG